MSDPSDTIVLPATTADAPGSSAGPSRRASSLPGDPRRALAAVRVLAIIALLVGILALAAAVFIWQRSERVVEQSAKRLQDAETRLTQLDQQYKTGQDQTRDLIGRVAVQESKFGEMSEQQAQLEKLYKNFAQDTLDGVLADAEVAVSVASQQLQVAGNVQAALVALEEAESSLKRADPQAVASLQRLLARDIDRLRGVPQTDIAAMSLRLDSTMSLLDQLPMLAGPTPPGQASGNVPAQAGDPQATPNWLTRGEALLRRWWESLRNELLGLIRVNRIDRPDAVMMAPEQQFFVRENLRLALLSARLALLSRDDAVLHSDLARAIDWLTRYYDTDNKLVANTKSMLAEMQQSKIAVDLPSLSETLTAVRSQRAAHDSAR